MEKLMVSIIIPVYNAEKYLAETINSATSQTWPHKEVIIIDDGSTDNSFKIARQYECDWVKIFRQQNKGASAARNKGLQEARGEYIQFLDADDLLSNDKIELQISSLTQLPDKIAVCSTIHFQNGSEPEDAEVSDYEENFLKDADAVTFIINLWGGYSKNGSMVQPNAWLTPRHLIDKAGMWDEEISLDDDGEFFGRVILASNGVLKTKGYNYYRRYKSSGNLSGLTSYRAKNSLLKSAISKKNNIYKCSSQIEAKYAIYKILTDVMIGTYKIYPDIYKAAKKELPTTAPPGYRPEIGGPIAKFITGIIGWKLTRQLQLITTTIFGK